MDIRAETPSDEEAIFTLTTAAFEPMPRSNGLEATIIDTLRRDGDLALSLVATQDDIIVGHIAFSPVKIDRQKLHWFGLGPVSVAVDKQRQGIGSALIREGLAQLKSWDVNGCVLVGNPAFYKRFGFKSHKYLIYGDMPPGYVQWLSFDEKTPKGALRYSPAFDAA